MAEKNQLQIPTKLQKNKINKNSMLRSSSVLTIAKNDIQLGL